MGFTPGHIDRALEAVPDSASRTIDNLISYMIDNPITEDEVRIVFFSFFSFSSFFNMQPTKTNGALPR